MQDSSQYHYKEGFVLLLGFQFYFCLFPKEQRYLKFCIQRQSLTLLALREKLIMPNSSHLVFQHPRKRHIHMAGMS